MEEPEEGPSGHEAARTRLPPWLPHGFWVTWTGTLLGPVLMLHHERFGVPALPYAQVFVLLLMVVLVNVRQRPGVDPTAHGPVYPALRRHGRATVVVIGGGALLTWGLALLGLPVPALVAGLVAGGLAAAQVWRIGLAVRDGVPQDR